MLIGGDCKSGGNQAKKEVAMTDVCHLNNDTRTGFGLWDLVDALDSWNVDSNEYYDDDYENDGDHGDDEDDKDDDDKWHRCFGSSFQLWHHQSVSFAWQAIYG